MKRHEFYNEKITHILSQLAIFDVSRMRTDENFLCPDANVCLVQNSILIEFRVF